MEFDYNKEYITSADLKKHGSREDLWICIEGKVYDVTEWIKKHPGGDVSILNLGGNDCTEVFIALHPGTARKHLDACFTGYYLRDSEVSEMSKDYRKLYADLSESGLFEKKGHEVMYTFIFAAVLLSICLFGVIWCEGRWMHTLSGGLLGLAWIQISYLGHDAAHYTIMSSRRINRFTQILTGNCLTGISMAWWKWTHNAHHIALNSLDYDPDLQHLPVLAVSSRLFQSFNSCFYGRELKFDPVARFLVSYQHLTFYPVMCVARANLFLQTLLVLLSKRRVPDRAVNILGTLVFWTWFPLLVSCLPNWGEKTGFVLASFCVCSIQHIQFCLNHFPASVYIGPPMGNDWLEKTASGTINISCSEWMDWFFGGLQFQIEHHLFPRLPRCQLRKIAPVVQSLCQKHNLPYRSLSFVEANITTLETLKSAAMEARENLLWEAVKTHG